MKKLIPQFPIAILAFVVIGLLMSFARPSDEQPKEYIILKSPIGFEDTKLRGLEKQVNQKLSEGWHVQGGVINQGTFYQAMVR